MALVLRAVLQKFNRDDFLAVNARLYELGAGRKACTVQFDSHLRRFRELSHSFSRALLRRTAFRACCDGTARIFPSALSKLARHSAHGFSLHWCVESVDLRPNFSALRRLGFDHPILISCGTLALGYAVVRRVCSPHGRSRSPERALFTPASFCKLRSTGAP
jgi:hypothetical protein